MIARQLYLGADNRRFIYQDVSSGFSAAIKGMNLSADVFCLSVELSCGYQIVYRLPRKS